MLKGVEVVDWWPKEIDFRKTRGVTGLRYAPLHTIDDAPEIRKVTTDLLWRTVDFVKKDSVSLHDIDMNRYRLAEREWDADEQYLQLDPYILNMTDVNRVRTGRPLPTFRSRPHMMSVASKYTSLVEGMSPNSEKHDTYLDIEPQTGRLLRGMKRLQENVYIDRKLYPNTFKFPNGTKRPEKDFILLPWVWLDEYARLNSEQADRFKSAVYGSEAMILAVFITLLIVGVLCMVGSVAAVASSCLRQRKEEVVDDEEANMERRDTKVSVQPSSLASPPAKYMNETVESLSDTDS
eukprot:NODE_1337_length_1190_cov_50.682734_g1100_i0.p1 GENE.NODE_1337_length_1190_cov_50.682734_g1100_i0~~NODE_1337_length_1190_cov_50.682734_g1100_i0.p1  ORF type:complete len:293 (-),score=87.75 NODE_1337_length_1190_cov_50.682734_g1100_i0:38-916(-)